MPQLKTTDALCRKHPASLWDDRVDGGSKSAQGETRAQRYNRHQQAVAICNVCPLLAPCRAVGIDDPMATGIWGGRLANDKTTTTTTTEGSTDDEQPAG